MPGVRTTHREYDEYAEVWRTCDDVVDGQRAMHKAGERYLPKLTEEGSDAYKARVKQTDFYNATWRTIAGLVGMAFRKDPTVEVPAAIEPYMANIDLAGTTLYTFAKEVCEEVLEYGRMGLLVDHPPMPENVTSLSQKAAETRGLRPSLRKYGPEHIINWRYGKVSNAKTLTMVVLQEEAQIAKSEFEYDEELRYRVLDLDENGQYRQRVYRIDDKGRDELVEGPIYPQMFGRALDFIPFYIIGTNGMALECDEPPLIDLIYANIAHYQVNSSYRSGLHFIALPTACFFGATEDETNGGIYLGSRRALAFRDPNANASFLEFKGDGIPSIERALQGIEQRMAVLGARMLADETSQVETLGATQIKRTGENSVLASIVIGVSQVLTRALEVMRDWSGASGEVKFEISREFLPAGMDPAKMRELLAAWQSGAISFEDYFLNMQSADIIRAEKTFEEHQEQVDAQGVVMPALSGSVAAA